MLEKPESLSVEVEDGNDSLLGMMKVILVLVIISIILLVSAILYSLFVRGSDIDPLNLGSCIYNGVEYDDGSEIPIDSCNSCTCDFGKVACTEMYCDEEEDDEYFEEHIDVDYEGSLVDSTDPSDWRG